MINPARQGIVDIGQVIADIENYWFLGVSTAVTISGILLDDNSRRAKNSAGVRSNAFTFSIPLGNGTNVPVNVATIMGLTGSLISNYPNAQGIAVNLSGAVFLDLQESGVADSDFKTNFANYPIINAGNGQKLARVN